MNYEPLITAIEFFKIAADNLLNYPSYEQTGWDWAKDERISHSFPIHRSRRLMFTQREADNAPTVVIPINKLLATQTWIRKERLRSELEDEPDPYPGGSLPLVVKEAGQYYIQDGHHRLKIARMRGEKTAEVRLIDHDKKIKAASHGRRLCSNCGHHKDSHTRQHTIDEQGHPIWIGTSGCNELMQSGGFRTAPTACHCDGFEDRTPLTRRQMLEAFLGDNE